MPNPTRALIARDGADAARASLAPCRRAGSSIVAFSGCSSRPMAWRAQINARSGTKGRARFVAAQGHEPDPVEFVRNFVDSKFPH
jgi:hypothetical protein